MKRPPNQGERSLTHTTTNTGHTAKFAINDDAYDPHAVEVSRRMLEYGTPVGGHELRITGGGQLFSIQTSYDRGWMLLTDNSVEWDEEGNIILTTTLHPNVAMVSSDRLRMAADLEQCAAIALYQMHASKQQMPQFIQIENNGPDIVTTDYWQTENAKAGNVYLSINAGAFRLLVPDPLIPAIKEMKTASEVIVSRGPWPDEGRHDALEIMFEDGSDAPYALHLGTESIDRLPTDADRDRPGQPPRWKLTVWTKAGKVLELPCRYQKVKRIPWMKAWVD